MINLKFLRIFVVFERVSQGALQKWYGKIHEGLVYGVQIDFQNARVKIPCEVLENKEVVPWVKTTEKPSWFQISLSVPGPHWMVLVREGRKISPHLNQKNGKWLVKFRNGTVVRFYGRKLVADYLAVSRQNNRWMFIQKERVAIHVPYHIKDKEQLRLFLQEEVEADIVEAAVELFNPSALKNEKWQKGLQEAVQINSPQPKSQPKPQQFQPQPQPKSQAVQIQQSEAVQEEEVLLPTIPHQKTKKKAYKERRQKERPPKRKRPPVHDDFEKELQFARKGNWRELLS